jgi:chromosome segregation ATPase
VIAEPVLAAYEARIKSLEDELEEALRQLERTENARKILLDYYDRHKAKILELQQCLSTRG